MLDKLKKASETGIEELNKYNLSKNTINLQQYR